MSAEKKEFVRDGIHVSTVGLQFEDDAFQMACPFCGVLFVIGKIVSPPELRQDMASLIHYLPTCDPFRTLAADDFLWSVNERLGLHSPEGKH